LGPESVANIILLPKFAPIALGDVATMLAEETRHLTLVALRHRTTLFVGWWPTAADDAERHRRMAAERLAALDHRRGNAVAEDEVVLVGGSERLTISYPALEAFMLNYYCPFVDSNFKLGTSSNSSSRGIALHLAPAALDMVDIRPTA
jgi:hypothetical protein